MDIETAKSLPLRELQREYRSYLEMCGFSRNTIMTAGNDSFYLWNKAGVDIFWKVVTSDEFEGIARKELLEALTINSKGDPKILVNGYLSHLRRFRKFLSVDTKEMDKNRKVVTRVSVPKTEGAVNIPRPCPEQVDTYLKRWATLENYHLQEDALDKLFFELCPKNTEISDILIKVATLNDFYSTNIFSVYPVAKHILELKIDKRLADGDVTLINDIKEVEVNGKMKNFYSFATKFCSHHKPLDYPIYDSYVEKVLLYFQRKDSFSHFNASDLKNYPCFKSVLMEFSKFYGLENYNLKLIDKYIWQIGKEYFPKNYKKKKN